MLMACGSKKKPFSDRSFCRSLRPRFLRLMFMPFMSLYFFCLTYTLWGYILISRKGNNKKKSFPIRMRKGAWARAERMEKGDGYKTKERQEAEYKDLIHRLNRIEGQIRGIKGMVEEGRYCTDILVQVAAVNAALNSFNKVLLANHIKSCVVNDIKEGREETIDELLQTLQKLMK